MALIGLNGGLIGSQRSAVIGAAYGIWTANEQVVLKRAGSWILDPDANAYITAVEAADGQPLEDGVKAAINSFILGCKADGIWSAIKASCILAGARTLSGALVPLVGTAPTNNNFVSGDYDRETGLVGDGSTKNLDSNRNHQTDPQNSRHMSCFVSTISTSASNAALIGSPYTATGWSFIVSRTSSGTPANRYEFGLAQGTYPSGVTRSTGFVGTSRSNSSNYTGRAGSASATYTASSQSPNAGDVSIFASTPSVPTDYVNARLAFYSIGESLDLALLDTRVTTLINAIAAAIP
jgi:hypothetical protein